MDKMMDRTVQCGIAHLYQRRNGSKSEHELSTENTDRNEAEWDENERGRNPTNNIRGARGKAIA